MAVATGPVAAVESNDARSRSRGKSLPPPKARPTSVVVGGVNRSLSPNAEPSSLFVPDRKPRRALPDVNLPGRRRFAEELARQADLALDPKALNREIENLATALSAENMARSSRQRSKTKEPVSTNIEVNASPEPMKSRPGSAKPKAVVDSSVPQIAPLDTALNKVLGPRRGRATTAHPRKTAPEESKTAPRARTRSRTAEDPKAAARNRSSSSAPLFDSV